MQMFESDEQAKLKTNELLLQSKAFATFTINDMSNHLDTIMYSNDLNHFEFVGFLTYIKNQIEQIIDDQTYIDFDTDENED